MFVNERVFLLKGKLFEKSYSMIENSPINLCVLKKCRY